MNNVILLIGNINDFDVIPNKIIEDVSIKKFTFDLNAHNLLKLPFTIKDFKLPISITKEIINVLLDDKLITDLPPAFMYT